MNNKTIKFRDYLVELILSGEKNVTWRLFDDKNFQKGDMAELINWNTGEVFGKAELINVREKPLGKLEESDFVGHEKFLSEEDMYQHYKEYYGDRVQPDTIVKIIGFKLL